MARSAYYGYQDARFAYHFHRLPIFVAWLLTGFFTILTVLLAYTSGDAMGFVLSNFAQIVDNFKYPAAAWLVAIVVNIFVPHCEE